MLLECEVGSVWLCQGTGRPMLSGIHHGLRILSFFLPDHVEVLQKVQRLDSKVVHVGTSLFGAR